jgi:hypothetical protein
MFPSIPPQRHTAAENRNDAVAHPNPPMIDRADHAPPSPPVDGSRGEEAPGEAPPGSSWTQKVSPKINLWAAILSALTAVAALLLSIVASVQQNSSPELSMTPPRRIVLGAGARGDSWNITIQPVFTIERESGRTTTVTDITLELQSPRGESVQPYWESIGSVEAAESGGAATTYKFESRARPIVVTADARHRTPACGSRPLTRACWMANGQVRSERAGQGATLQAGTRGSRPGAPVAQLMRDVTVSPVEGADRAGSMPNREPR